jgi:hypothetical protein
MKYYNLPVRILIIVCLLINSNTLCCQLNKLDSLAIKISHAINLTDSINSPLPNSIRLVTIEHFLKVGMDPSEYYIKTDRDINVIKSNNLDEYKSFKIHSQKDFLSLDTSCITEDEQLIASFYNIKIETYWDIEFYRIAGLRDYCFWNDSLDMVRIGGWGKDMDNIFVRYNSNFSKIINISNVE